MSREWETFHRRIPNNCFGIEHEPQPQDTIIEAAGKLVAPVSRFTLI